jgi:uncharacterized membrane protein (UPF0136 family)
MIFYAITVFLSAFLLFQVQPLIAKMILPWFGGSSSVWNTCMLFFQVTLLAGYLYAHWVHEKLTPRGQAILHSMVLALSLFVLPIIPDASWKPLAGESPAWRILGLLTATVGLPYFLLSTTSPLIQTWYARTHEGATPYRLFALSNFASLVGLLAYPVLVEPNLATRNQALVWSGLFAVFAVFCGVTAWRSLGGEKAVRAAMTAGHENGEPPGLWRSLFWLLLAACPSALLLSTTTFLTQDVAAVPFLWVLPLAVYLSTFILAFEFPRLYNRSVFMPWLIPALGMIARFLWPQNIPLPVPAVIAICCLALFVFAMFCHGELASRKPAPRHLTKFYLMLSLGGALGGLFVALVAPAAFRWNYEFPLGLMLCASLAAVVILLEYWRPLRPAHKALTAVALAGGLAGYGGVLARAVELTLRDYHVVKRNFYSQIRVRDADYEDGYGPRRMLVHGVINHGEQLLSPEYRLMPISYFCPDSGVGQVMSRHAVNRPRRIGILGLGCGNLLAYGRPGDVIRVYEINPQVVEVAREEFTFLRDTPARVETVLGDGRLELEHDPPQNFDILVMDAFSGDSVPVHLITREAIHSYRNHLRRDGVLVVNVTNKYLNMLPVMASAATDLGLVAYHFSFIPDPEDTLCNSVDWVVMIDPAAAPSLPGWIRGGVPLQRPPGFRTWTDDFSNLLRILR